MACTNLKYTDTKNVEISDMHKLRRDWWTVEINTGSFVCMEENITTIFFKIYKYINKEATEWNYYKATGGMYHTHNRCVAKKDKDEEERDVNQKCGNVLPWRRRYVMENNNAVACKKKGQKESTEELLPPHLHNVHAKWVPSCQRTPKCLTVPEKIMDENETSISGTELGCHPTSVPSMLNE